MQEKLKSINKRIEQAAARSGKDSKKIALIAVSKTKPVEIIKQAIDAGAANFGENYIQHAKDKIEELLNFPSGFPSGFSIKWHFIGHLQSNKAKYAVKLFDLIHTVDSVKLAKEIDKQAAKNEKIQNVLVQVNIGHDEAKSGIHPDETADLIRNISIFKNISIKGLMTITPFFTEPENSRPLYKALYTLREKLQSENISNVSLTELSMGMTNDFEIAVEEGATMVRIGTAIFGERI